MKNYSYNWNNGMGGEGAQARHSDSTGKSTNTKIRLSKSESRLLTLAMTANGRRLDCRNTADRESNVCATNEPNNYQGFTCRNQQAGSNVTEHQSNWEGPGEDRSTGHYFLLVQFVGSQMATP